MREQERLQIAGRKAPYCARVCGCNIFPACCVPSRTMPRSRQTFCSRAPARAPARDPIAIVHSTCIPCSTSSGQATSCTSDDDDDFELACSNRANVGFTGIPSACAANSDKDVLECSRTLRQPQQHSPDRYCGTVIIHVLVVRPGVLRQRVAAATRHGITTSAKPYSITVYPSLLQGASIIYVARIACNPGPKTVTSLVSFASRLHDVVWFKLSSSLLCAERRSTYALTTPAQHSGPCSVT